MEKQSDLTKKQKKQLYLEAIKPSAYITEVGKLYSSKIGKLPLKIGERIGMINHFFKLYEDEVNKKRKELKIKYKEDIFLDIPLRLKVVEHEEYFGMDFFSLHCPNPACEAVIDGALICNSKYKIKCSKCSQSIMTFPNPSHKPINTQTH